MAGMNSGSAVTELVDIKYHGSFGYNIGFEYEYSLNFLCHIVWKICRIILTRVVKFIGRGPCHFLLKGGLIFLITQWNAFVIVLLTNAIIAAAMAFLLGRKHFAPGRNAMVWMLAGLAIWALCYAMITLSDSLEAKRFWLRMENIGILTVPVFWFLFTLQ